MVSTMERARDALRGLTLEADGVDGGGMLLYGEGWDFGEVTPRQAMPAAHLVVSCSACAPAQPWRRLVALAPAVRAGVAPQHE